MIRNNSMEQFEKALKEQARKTGTPLSGAFEITGRCNYNCKMCYVHVQDNDAAMKRELTTEQWIKIMDAAYDAGMLYAVISGGECLLRSDFKELYLHLYNKGIQISITSNGSLLTDEYVEFFAKYPPRQIQISLYGSNDQVYERITDHRDFNRISGVLKKLKVRGINLLVAVTPSKYLKEKDDITELITYLRTNGYRYVVGPFLLAPRDGLTRESFDMSEEEQIEVLKAIRHACGEEIKPVEDCRLPQVGGMCTEERFGLPCSAGTTRFTITWDGYMVPCIAIETPRIKVLEKGFLESWAEIRRNNEKIRQPVECVGCAYESVCVKCPTIRTSDLFSGHCNKDTCRFTVAKVRSGVSKLSKQ